MSFARALLMGLGFGIVVILFLEGFGLAQVARPAAAVRVAQVNGDSIFLEEVDALLAQRTTPLTPPTVSQIRQMRFEVLAALIDDLLIRQFMREHGPKVDAAEIDKQIAALETSLKAQGKSLAEYLRELNQTTQQLRASMLMLHQLDRYVKERSSEADLKKYFEANQAYFEKVSVRSSHIVIRLPENATAGEKEKARQKLLALRADIVSGKLDFARAAKENSQCPSAAKGGDIGPILRKFQYVEEAYAKAAFALKVGEISDVVETESGVHLIKVVERSEGKPTKFEQCIDDVRDCYAEDLRVDLLNQLRAKSKVEITLP